MSSESFQFVCHHYDHYYFCFHLNHFLECPNITFKNSWYIISVKRFSWHWNRNKCQSQGGDLVSMETEEEWNFINWNVLDWMYCLPTKTNTRRADTWNSEAVFFQPGKRWLRQNLLRVTNMSWYLLHSKFPKRQSLIIAACNLAIGRFFSFDCKRYF